jgi:4-carboxymuconolactone decarboxylase
MTDIAQRIPRCPKEEWTDEHRKVHAFWGEPNAWEEGSKTEVMNVMANHPPLGQVYNQWGKHFLMENTLNTRQLEIIILRVAKLTNSAYEWHNHVGYGMNAGLTLDEIAAIRDFPNDWNWNAEEAALLRACDEQIGQHRISDEAWAVLAGIFSRQQLMDMVFSIGHYAMTGWALASFGVPIEGGADVIGFDLKTRSGRTPGATLKPGETEDWIDTRGY